MASSADVIVLSSSPNPPSRTPTQGAYDPDKLFGISPPAATPPPMPSPSELFQFPSRSRFFPSPGVIDDTTKKKRRTSKTSDPSDKNVPSKPRPKTKKATKESKSSALGDLRPESLDSRENAAKKARGSHKGRLRASAKSKESGIVTLAGKVTKASSDLQAKKPSKTGKKTAATQSTTVDPTEQAGPNEANAVGKDKELHLDEAVRRRMDWTPPKETAPKGVFAVDDDDDDEKVHQPSPKGGFGSLLSDYNYSQPALGPLDLSLKADGGGPTKRRRIELVDPQVYPQSNSKVGLIDESSAQGEDSSSSGAQTRKKKAKSQKRFTTLTARMTAQYSTTDTQDDALIDDVVPDIGKARSRRGKTKPKNDGSVFTVLSPEAAAKSLENQDLIFGTCSQLEREDSPQTLREMQQAIRASEGLVFDEIERNAVPVVATTSASQSQTSRSLSDLTGSRNLWRVAARDTEGSLVQAEEVETVDLTCAPQISKEKDDANASASASQHEDDWYDLDYGKPGPPSTKKTALPEKSSDATTKSRRPVSAQAAAPVGDVQAEATKEQTEDFPQPSMPQYSGFTDVELSKQVAAYGFKSVRGRKKMVELLQKCWQSKNGNGSKGQAQPTSQPESSRPVTSSQAKRNITITQTEVQSTKPKSKGKSKSKPKQSASLPASTDTTTQPDLVASSTPKKSSQPVSKSGRLPPPSSYVDVEEIQDSEEEVFLSPSQVQKRYTEMFSNASSSAREPSLDILTKAPPESPTKRKTTASKSSRTPKPLPSLTTTKADKTQSSQRSSQAADLNTQITKAVRAQPSLSPLSPSAGSRSRPTWHEKILMYDPIILEDLTTWLNVEGLGLVGEDREVGTAAVREWCESKGICCCWKKNASW